MQAKVLVVASQTIGSKSLLRVMREQTQAKPTSFTLLVPGGADLDAAVLQDAVAVLRAAGMKIETRLGDPDPFLAVRDVWDPASYDEVIVSTLPDQTSRWLRSGLPFRIQRMTGALVRHVTDDDEPWNEAGRAVDAIAVKAPAASSLRRRRVLSGA
jgi:hypothetical protein